MGRIVMQTIQADTANTCRVGDIMNNIIKIKL